MKKSIFGVVVLALLIGLVAVFFYRQDEGRKEQPPAPVAVEAELAQEIAEVAPRHPIPIPPDRVEKKLEAKAKAVGVGKDPLPSLSKSDGTMRELLASLFDVKLLGKVGILNHFIQRFVVTIDNIPERQLPRSQFPTRAPGGLFIAGGAKGREFISPKNFRRYANYVGLLETLDTEKGVAGYIRFYPLFQKAYRELGYPSASFHYRFMEVLDHLLATPVVPEPIALVRPGVFYQFADPELERLSGGQKILIRTGSDNAARVKAKLRELRQELIDQTQNG